MALETGRFSAKYALSLAATLMAGGMALPAAAADLGGNCCADLEERVAELEATTARKGNRKVSLTVSGQVETALMAWDNGDRSDVYVVDVPTVGGTFFQFNGDAKINPSLSAGFLIQVGFDRGSRSHQVNEVDDDGGAAGDTSVVITLANWYLDHKQLGRVTVGRANTATAGITGIDLGGAGVIANVNVGYWNRAFTAIGAAVSTGATSLAGGTVNGSTLSRGNVINYTTPTFGGFSASAAWGENDVWDVGPALCRRACSGFRVAAGIGYSSNVSGLGEVTARTLRLAGLGHADHGEGIGQHPARGDRPLPDLAPISGRTTIGRSNDTTLWYVNGGIAKNWTGLGNTVLYGEYARVDDGVAVRPRTHCGRLRRQCERYRSPSARRPCGALASCSTSMRPPWRCSCLPPLRRFSLSVLVHHRK